MKIVSIVLVAILLFFGIVVSKCNDQRAEDRLRYRKADALALNTAFDVSTRMGNRNECPKSIEGWVVDSSYANGKLVFYSDGITLIYSCNIDHGFSVLIRTAFDSGQSVSGTKDGIVEYSYGHFTNRKKVVLNSRSEIESTLNKIYH
ncbi:hypothetical protein QFX18_19335 [Saccharophagus degradans]|uniref:hypothetical protein n=1 Tax=Saccharophagus degradans TaxID=86304 RepID=UPI002477D211|nr:hypothetical protein [Saccharophagus degradans]WGO98164.1 hypothetical protein QFX18_19335 [Saccharophagus degradans]